MGHWYFLLAAVAAGILLWWTLGEKIIVVWRAARHRISPAPVPPPPTPAVVLDVASYDISTTPLHERKLVQDNALVG